MDFKLRHLMLLMFILILSKQAIAANVNYTARSSVGYSDNITRTGIAANQLKDSIASIGGTLSIVDESSTNDFILDMSADYVDYRNNTFEEEIIANIALASNFSLVDDSFTWTLDGYYGQQAISAFTVVTPNNLQNTGFVSTGPNLVYRFTDLDSLTLGYRYRDFYAEQTPSDYQSNVFSAVLARRLSPLHTLSFNIETENLTYDDPFISSFADFENLQYTIALTGASRTNQYGIEFGVINVKFDTGTRGDNDVYRFFFNRDMNSSNTLSLQLSRTVENGARAVTGIIPGVVTTGLFANDLAQFSYGYNRGGLQIDFNSTYSDQDFITQNSQDRKNLNNSISFLYGTPRNIQVGLSYNRLERDFYTTGIINNEDTITLNLEKQIFTNIIIGGTYINFTRKTTNVNVPVSDIEENRVILTLRYLGRI